LLAKRLHRAPPPTETCPAREERRRCERSGAVTPSRAEPRLRVAARGLTSLQWREGRRSTSTPRADPVSAPAPRRGCSGRPR
jgi:hypothetical protein